MFQGNLFGWCEPLLNEVSFKKIKIVPSLSKFREGFEVDLDWFGEIAAHSSQIEVLHIVSPKYLDRYSKANSGLRMSCALPILRELKLVNYNWGNSIAGVITSWNWTNISLLELKGGSIYSFLASVDPLSLFGLKILRTDGFSNRRENDRKTTDLICSLLGSIDRLEEFHFRGRDLSDQCLPAAMKHAASLKSLSPRYGSKMKIGNPKTLRCLSAKDLSSLSHNLAKLVELSIDADVFNLDVS